MKILFRIGLSLLLFVLLAQTGIAQSLTISTFAGPGTVGLIGDGGPATQAQLRYPKGIAVDAAGSVYVVDSGNSRVRKVTLDGMIITVAGTGVPDSDGDGGLATSAQLAYPYGIAVDVAGNLYIADRNNNRIRKVTVDGIIRTVAGTGESGFSGDGGPAVSAQLASPSGIAVDAAGNLYITDSANNRVRMVTPNGVIATIAGTGTPGFGGDFGPAALAALSGPTGIAVDTGGNLYIADSDNNCVRTVTASGAISTIAGTGIPGFSGDGGPATSAALNDPEGIALDAAGKLYIADTANNRIREVDASGIISTVAGNGIDGSEGDGGPAITAQLSFPTGIAVDPSGYLYSADTANSRIRKIQKSVAPVSDLQTFRIVDRGGMSLTTDGVGNNIEVGYGRIQPDAGSTTPSGVAIFGFRANNVLVSEASVPASPLLTSGRIYAEVSSDLVVNTGLAIANPNSEAARINFFFTDLNGDDFGAGSTTIQANQQVASFLNQAPFNGGAGIHGTFSFTSTIPVSVVALRGFTNERSEFLITTLPVIDTTAVAEQGTVFLAQFADGGGWTTQIILVNPGDTPMKGNVQFGNVNGGAASVTIGAESGSSFAYSVAARSSQDLRTSGFAPGTASGSVRINPDGGGPAPKPLVVFSFKPFAFTVSEAGVPAVTGNALRVYVESSGRSGVPGNIQSGVAVANTSPAPTTVILDLTQLDGSSTGLPAASITLPPFGQTAKFLSEIFPLLPSSFKGVLRITGSSPVSAVGLRGRYNERGDFLITTMPTVIENNSVTSVEGFFPHLVNSGGYTTQFILFCGSVGQSATGTLRFVRQDGSAFPLSVN